MPASKTFQYSENEKELALQGRALAHPARVRIMNLINEFGAIRNLDITKKLQLSKSTVHRHMKKLQDASLIKTEFYLNSFYVSKNENIENADEELMRYK